MNWFVVIVCFFSCGTLFCQIDESEKVMILYSLGIDDGLYLSHNENTEQYLRSHESIANAFPWSVETARMRSENIADVGARSLGYELKLYKIRLNETFPARYLLRYTNYVGQYVVWLRVSGYYLNDTHLLFKHLTGGKRSKKMLRKLLDQWGQRMPLLAEVDTDCLIEAYSSDKHTLNCYTSASYWLDTIGAVGEERTPTGTSVGCRAFLPLSGRFLTED